MSLCWKTRRWRHMGEDGGVLKMRQVVGAVFDGRARACVFEITEIRNVSNDVISGIQFHQVCDDESEDLGEFAAAAMLTHEQVVGDTFIIPDQAFAEVSRLYVSEEYRGQRTWAFALTHVLRSLALDSGRELFCALQAAPLELAWRRRALLDNPDLQALPTDREAALEARRIAALKNLYAKSLGFVHLPGQWLGAEIDPLRQTD